MSAVRRKTKHQHQVSLRHREIVIDRTCARCGCDYERGVHVAFAHSVHPHLDLRCFGAIIVAPSIEQRGTKSGMESASSRGCGKHSTLLAQLGTATQCTKRPKSINGRRQGGQAAALADLSHRKIVEHRTATNRRPGPPPGRLSCFT
jgi:hypothetical protein